MSVHFHCYAPHPSAHLAPALQSVLAVLRDARGIFRTIGFRSDYVAAQADMTTREAKDALHELETYGLAARVTESVPIRHGGTMTITRWRLAAHA